MFEVEIVSTGSHGNFNVIDGVIAIDAGVRRDVFAPLARDLDHILISHEHSDHINPANVRWLYQNRPAVFRHGLHMNRSTIERVARAGKWSGEAMRGFSSVIGPESSISLPTRKGVYQVETYLLDHDVENQGFVITAPSGQTLIHATDTTTMEYAPRGPFDALLVEGNWDQDRAYQAMEDAVEAGDDEALRRVMQNMRHLSVQDCRDFLVSCARVGAQAWQLHESSAFGMTIGAHGLDLSSMVAEVHRE